MVKEKYLLILQNSYPYETGEPFFNTELPYLSKKFNKIFIFSVNGVRGSGKRPIPNNCVAVPLNCTHKKKGLFFLNGIIGKKPFNLMNWPIKKAFSSIYIRGKNYTIFKKIKREVDKLLPLKQDIVIYSYWMTLGVASIYLKQYLEKKYNIKVPFYSRGHGYDVYSEVMPFNFWPYQEKVISLSSGTFICSKYGCEYLKKKYPSQAHKIKISRLGTLDYGENSLAASPTTTFITIAGARPVKRLGLLIQSFAALKALGCPFQWVYIGDGEEYLNIKTLIKELDLEDNCLLLGSKSNEEAMSFYKHNHIDYFVLTSESEGIPVAIMEASSFGIPTISTNVGGIAEIIDNECGFLLNKDSSPKEIANILKQAITMPREEKTKKRIVTRAKWEQMYSAEKNYSEWCDVLYSGINT